MTMPRGGGGGATLEHIYIYRSLWNGVCMFRLTWSILELQSMLHISFIGSSRPTDYQDGNDLTVIVRDLNR